MSIPNRRRRPFTAKRCAITLLACALVTAAVAMPATKSAAYTKTSIVIDGNAADWTPVLADPDNVVRDTQGLNDDPDHPIQPDRDVYLVASTYDDTYLYFLWRRTASGSKAITLAAYLDYQGDGLLQDGDKVVFYTVSTGNPTASFTAGTARILNYHQARWPDGSFQHPQGDPMRDIHSTGVPTGDGETPDGYAEIQGGQTVPKEALNAQLDANGIITEARVAWSDLGVATGHPFAVHFATGNGEKFGVTDKPSVSYKFIGQPSLWTEEFRGNVEDNVEPIMHIGSRGITLTPNASAGGAPGSTVEYVHTLRNTGNSPDVYDLTALSAHGWPYEIVDLSGNPITSVALAANTETTFRLRVTIPLGTADGTVDDTVIRAVSQADPSFSATVKDSTTAGLVTLTPNQRASVAPGQYVDYSYTVRNNSAATGTFTLDASSNLGFDTTISDGSGTVISSITLAAGQAATVNVRVLVPASATQGTQDTMRLTASLQGNPTVHAQATGTTTVLDGFSLAPNNSGFGGAGTTVQYTHTITNNWPVARTFTLTSGSSRGWPVAVYAADGVTPITAITVGPYGASADILVRVSIPAGVPASLVDVTTLTASNGASSLSVTDTTTIRRLSTFEDPGCVTQRSAFTLGDTVYARATGLPPGDVVYYVWRDSNGDEVRRSQNLSVDAFGMVFDNVNSTTNLPTGTWTATLYSSKNATLETATFTMTYNASITGLFAADAPSLDSPITVTSQVTNRNAVAITGSAVRYLMWWDGDGDDVFGAGDTYIDASGAPHVWNGSSAVPPSHTASNVNVPADSALDLPEWSVRNKDFPSQGYYRVTATWKDAGGDTIDVKTTQFYSIPTLGWPIFALVFGGLAAFLGRRLVRTGSQGGGSL